MPCIYIDSGASKIRHSTTPTSAHLHTGASFPYNPLSSTPQPILLLSFALNTYTLSPAYKSFIKIMKSKISFFILLSLRSYTV